MYTFGKSQTRYERELLLKFRKNSENTNFFIKTLTLFEFMNNFLKREYVLKIHKIFRKCVSFIHEHYI